MLEMMKELLLIVTFVVAATANIGPNDIAPKILNDCAPKITENHQRRLFFKYRGLWDFRHHVQPNAFIDFYNRSGTVMFLNWQADILNLTCPCKGVKKWKQFGTGQESGLFNKHWKTDETGLSLELIAKAPGDSIYYRTFACINGHEQHYFNVFTRPGPETDFPVGFTEDSGGDLGWYCFLIYSKLHFRECTHGPYDFDWIFPLEKKLGTKEMYKERQLMMKKGKTNMTYFAKMDGSKIGKLMEMKKKDKEKEDIQLEGWSKLEIIGKANLKLQAGIFECVVTDRNGLSSSYKLDNLDDTHPTSRLINERYNGFVHVHIRQYWFIFIPITLAIVIILITLLCVWKGEDNIEDLIFQNEEEARIQRQTLELLEREAAEEAAAAAAAAAANPIQDPSQDIPTETVDPVPEAVEVHHEFDGQLTTIEADVKRSIAQASS